MRFRFSISRLRHDGRWLSLVAAVVCSGCASREPLPSFYALDPPAAAAPAAILAPGPRIFIRRVTLPGYLQPTTIASRRAEDQIEYSATALWAEGLRTGFGRRVATAQKPENSGVEPPQVFITGLTAGRLNITVRVWSRLYEDSLQLRSDLSAALFTALAHEKIGLV